MAEGYFERGEIYWVKMGSGVGAEINVTRPGLVISSEEVNNASDAVLVVFLTTKPHRPEWNKVSTFSTGKESWVLCDQVQTVDKSRFTKLLGVMASHEMREVENALEKVFDLGYVDDAALKEKDKEIGARDAVIAEKNAEIAALKSALTAEKEKVENVELSYKVESAMWQKLYEKALNQVVDMKYTSDLFLKNHLGREELPKEPELPKIPEPPKAPVETPEEVEKVDVNHCTITVLKKLGFSLALAHKIVDGRPYNTVSDLKSVPGMKATQYRIMEPKLCCTPVKKYVVNGGVPDLGYEAEEGVEPEAPMKKVNVNTASAKEIAECLGISVNVACAITGKRKREGLFTSLEQIVVPKRFSEKSLEKYRDKLEV